MKYAWVKNHCDSYDVNTMCRALAISRSGYYRWLKAAPSATQRRVARIGAEAKRVFEENHGAVGYRKVQEQLVAEGVPCCPETVRKTLTRQGLHATVAPRFVPTTTDSDHNLPVAENWRALRFMDAQWAGQRDQSTGIVWRKVRRFRWAQIILHPRNERK